MHTAHAAGVEAARAGVSTVYLLVDVAVAHPPLAVVEQAQQGTVTFTCSAYTAACTGDSLG